MPTVARLTWRFIPFQSNHGRVRGLEGLRTADASIMPDCTRANTNVTTMMIGERISDFIRQGER